MIAGREPAIIIVFVLKRNRVHFRSQKGQEQIEDVNAEAVGYEVPPLADDDAGHVGDGEECCSDPSKATKEGLELLIAIRLSQPLARVYLISRFKASFQILSRKLLPLI